MGETGVEELGGIEGTGMRAMKWGTEMEGSGLRGTEMRALGWG